MNRVIASRGIRTARPQFTRGSFLRSSYALTVAGFTARASAASYTVSNFVMRLTSEWNVVDTPYPAKIRCDCGNFDEKSTTMPA
jgi:hypothetical protein